VRVEAGRLKSREWIGFGRGWRLVRLFRSVIRSAKLAGVFLYASAVLVVTRPTTREARAEWLHGFCARAVKRMGIGVRVIGSFPERGAVISNHLGYLDIVAFAALHRCVFVSKAEIRKWPVLGWMTTMSGTVYVERGRGGSALRAKGGMQAAAEAGLPVVFFPEGTTTNGETVAKFHSGILAMAMESGEPVTAAYVTYRLTEDNGAGVTVADVCYWDDTPLVLHIFRLLGLRGVDVEVRFAEGPIVFSEEVGRKMMAAEARGAVLRVGGVVDAASSRAGVVG
jgi:lyso-ornithine lipid O-acyltransferase